MFAYEDNKYHSCCENYRQCSLVMLVYVGFIILTFAGSVLAGNKPPKCNHPEHSCPKNEHYTRNNSRCIRTCANKWVPISDDCTPFTGCVCNDGYVRLNDDASGPCVPERKCPKKCKDPNAIYKKCPNPCPLSCDHPFPKVCTKACLENGCECAPGFILDCNGKCIRPEDCPKPIHCPKHSHYVMNDNQCPKTCGNRLLPNSDVAGACVPFTGCACDPGYVRKYDNATGPCIKEKDCPPIPCNCGVNEVPSSCAIVCPPQTCDSMLSKYYCPPTECEPGCDCLNGFLRNDEGICIPSEDCFKPHPIECNGPNEIYSDCAITCPPQTCERLFVDYLCAAEAVCAAGCNCLDGYLRNSLGICVTIEECYNDPGGCNGDLNATRAHGCGNPNPPTCENPEPKGSDVDVCVLNGCQCKEGYIVCDDGNCIATKDCPGGSPKCGANKTYVDCKFNCPTNYCPVDDSRAQVACSLPYPCQGGCACLAGYLVVSSKDPRCVLASDCPEVKCTRPNEVWDPNPSRCFFERCEERGSECDYPYPSGPRCVCKEGYYRNEDDVCIPASKCPPLGCKGDFNATLTVCPNPCPKTCDDPDAGDGGCIEICLQTDCQCNEGYFLTKKVGGKCIKPEDCESCKGDPNAVYSYCPSACEPTCENPDPNQGCTKQCLPPGCICRDGFVLNKETGKCIKSEQCPKKGCGGDPNAVYSHCRSSCEPTCDNPYPQKCTHHCLKPGCVCKPGYVKSACGKCIKPEACPEKGCGGDPNAVYSHCRSSCEPTCDNPYPQNCTHHCFIPGCVCKPGYVKSACGKCIKLEDCPDKGCGGDPNAVYSHCRSSCEPTCDNPYPKMCTHQCLKPGCVCKPGYVKSACGKCIKPEDCPEKGCGGDPNAVYSHCRSSCEPTCDNPYPKMCTHQCLRPGCVCKPGYVKSACGKCIKLEDCPGCGGDPNAVYSHCRSSCEPTCDNPYPRICNHHCLKPGCVCKPGYVKSACGKCIKLEDCPGCGGDPNAVYSHCRSSCEPTCDNPYPRICNHHCLKPGCVCKPGYVKSASGKCIKLQDCPVKDKGCNGDLNATYSECPSYCPATCENLYRKENEFCPAACDPSGCVCKRGYVLTKRGGICIKPEDCPVPCCKDPNAEYKECPSACEPTCSNPDPKFCTRQCMPPGCVCKKGYVLNKETGKCVEREKCPVPCCKDPNAEYKECPSACEPNCTNPEPEFCTDQCMPPGCVCKKEFVLNEVTGLCVKRKECPDCKGDPNAEYSECPSACQPTCKNPDPKICTLQCLPPGCVCKIGFVRNEATGKCVKREECPDKLQCDGDRNATYVQSPSYCQATCKNPDPEDQCMEMPMPPGCVCKHGFIRRKNGGQCIKPEDCPGGWPTCRQNETYVYCKVGCPNNYCPVDDSLAIIACDPMYPCPGGCACEGGHLIVSVDDDRCILSSECPPVNCTRPNEVWDPHAPGCLHERCDDKDIPCDFQYPGPPRCRCIKGYYRNQDGICVPECECPKPGCNGDLNATFSKCPSRCPATCCEPDSDRICTTDCAKPGCVCNEGFIQSKRGGPCISPYDCDGGSPHCSENMTYTSCKIDCPTKYCPQDENEVMVICDPIWPCPTGCECKQGYLKTNTGNKTCILAADCPPVNCTRLNEVWDPSPSICNYERCDEMYYECSDPTPGRPKCVCKPGYYRDKDGVCIPAKKCPKSEPPICGYNEVAVPCRQICPPQNCDIAYTDYACTEESKICEPGCNCLPDHLRNGSGICIPNDQCSFEPKPICGYNEVAVPCRQICPPQNCEIAYTDYACTEEHTICEPGCDCLPDHLRNGSGICIPNDQCPYPSTPVCGINEIARDCRRICPPQTCLSKYALFRCIENLPCEPGCDCVPNYLRDERGICIPSEKCPAPCQIPDECKRTCAEPNPPNCVYNPPKENLDGCDCKEGYILEKLGGNCIPIDQCPPDIACHGDPNAIPNRCPKPCPSTCESPDQLPCKRMCEPIACQCKSGYILSNNTESARCILPDKCKGGNPCGKTGRFVDCKTDCPHDYCPVDDSRDLVFCDPPAGHCLSGCICNINHKRKSRADRRCIVSSKCPPVNCTRPNEKWSSCPSACLAENCEDIDNQPSVCNTLVLNCEPRCICKKHHFRNSSGICVCAEDCPPPGCGGDPNAVHSDCPSACPATCTNQDPQICTAQCMPPGCVCKDGLVLNEDTGKCVERENCPVPVCKDPNAVYKECPSACEPTCDNPEPKVCTDQCMPPRCVCKKGYVLDEKNGKCVEKCDCPDH